MCDVESYIYMPLLEEMDYMPKRKYASGEELRSYAGKLADKFDLHKRAMFQTAGRSMYWDKVENVWRVTLCERPKGGSEVQVDLRFDNVIFATGVLSDAKLPSMGNAAGFTGKIFHTARWDYDFTGGTQHCPEMTRLQDKSVAIVGTGATAVQCIPELAKWAGKLFVFQRTPSSIAVRNNHDTDPEVWCNSIAAKKGWSEERNKNFNAFVTNERPLPAIDLVGDGWTQAKTYSGLIGGPCVVDESNVGEYVRELHDADVERSEGIRRRVVELVQNSNTAEVSHGRNGSATKANPASQHLQAWYPTWCKRPCFHDEYLDSFNRPNVTLVDTDGKGITGISQAGVMCNGTEYPVDLIVMGTGFVPPSLRSPAGKAGIQVTGKDGQYLEHEFEQGKLNTLHGVISRGFPNMYWPGPFQATASVNQVHVLDILSTHIAYIITASDRRVGGRAIVEPLREAEDEWALTISRGAYKFAALAGCTPSYSTLEGQGAVDSPEQQWIKSKSGIWPDGVNSFSTFLADWRTNRALCGLDVRKLG